MTTRDDRLAQAQKALQAGDFEKGMALAAALVDEDPGDSEALYMAAVAARYLKRFVEAERHLAALHGRRQGISPVRRATGLLQLRPSAVPHGSIPRSKPVGVRWSSWNRRPVGQPPPKRRAHRPSVSPACRANWSR